MNGFRLGILALVGLTLATSGSDEAHAQIYGGLYYGPGRQYSGIYAGGYVPGPYAGGYYGSPYGYGIGFGSGYGVYGMGYPYGTGYSYTTGNALNTGNAYATGNAVSTINSPGTTYYGNGTSGYGATYGQSGYGYTSPTAANPSPAYATSTSIIRSGPTGGVMQYTAKGDGYTYIPDSTYPTLILNQPTLGLSRTYVPPSPNPVVVESRPQGAYTPQYSSNALPPFAASTGNYGMIKLSLPKTATGPLRYSLNGHQYTIQPGYSQSFRNDRAWTVEFNRDGGTSEVARYLLSTGTYTFGVGSNGWELQQPGGSVTNSDLPPSPQPNGTLSPLPAFKPSPANTTPSLSPAPTPLPPP